MSRSFRKNFIITDGQRKKSGQVNRRKLQRRKANKKIRALKNEDIISSGRNYKKFYESWNICDWRSRYDSAYNKGERRIWKWRNK